MCPPLIAAVGAAASSAGTAIAGLSTAAKASLLIGGAQAGMTIAGQRQQAKTQAKVQANASAAERQRYLQEVSSMRVQQGQEEVAAAQKIQESIRKTREAKATAFVAAGERGVAGLSVDSILRDMDRQLGRDQFNTAQQLQINDVGRSMQLENAVLGFTNNMLRINRPIEQPNYLGSALSGAQTGLSTYSVTKDL